MKMDAPPSLPHQIVVMGVSAVGKTVIGRGIATQLSVPFIDADTLHPRENVAKMAAGTPLNDDDRWPWLDAVGETAADSPDGIVVACSALRRVYRDRIRKHSPRAVFVQLTGSPQLLAERAAERTDHFMPQSLLASQLALLEVLDDDEAGVSVDVSPTPDAIIAMALQLLPGVVSTIEITKREQ